MDEEPEGSDFLGEHAEFNLESDLAQVKGPHDLLSKKHPSQLSQRRQTE